MAKNDKNIKNLQKRIDQLEAEMAEALKKKRSGSTYDVPKTMKLIADLKQDIKRLQ